MRCTFFSQTHFLTNHGTSRSCLPGLEIFGYAHSRQDPDDGHHNHQLNQGEPLLLALAIAKAFEKDQLGARTHEPESNLL